jgi:HD-GYP domain-containing protein (c-di-GMP phosphodiesterase class II)
MILLSSANNKKLIFKTGFGYTTEQLNILKNSSFNIDKPDSKATFVVSFNKKIPFIVNDVEDIKNKITQHSFEFARKMGTKSFICVPIIYENDSLGLLVVDNINTKRPLLQSDINLLMGIAPQIGISIRNAMLIKSKLEQFNSILFVLAASIDARDFLTAGHSEKVMEYSIGICNELGLSKDYTEMIRIAALLHDYGKIGVPDSILKKSGSLSPEEYKEIQTHAEKTCSILERISFEGLYEQIPKIAGCHHEKLDGTGYPNGLKGDQIPLGARIIAVADFFEAITAKRHYREPMPVDVAMNLLTEESGKHLEKELVEAFKRYYSKTFGWNPSVKGK